MEVEDGGELGIGRHRHRVDAEAYKSMAGEVTLLSQLLETSEVEVFGPVDLMTALPRSGVTESMPSGEYLGDTASIIE